jgi:shikimate dehydrogenase
MLDVPNAGNATICGIIGDPIGHTMSPVMHNTAFHVLGLNYRYHSFTVKKEELGDAIAQMRARNICGLNVTLPHKVSVLPYLDELDPLARALGAVNTIVNDHGVLKGYNTDAPAFLEVLSAKGVAPEGKNIVILGAGGTGRTLAFILAKRGAHITILNRTAAAARALAEQVKKTFQTEVAGGSLEESALALALLSADVVVNATSVGMSPHTENTPVPQRLLRPGLVIFDVVYNPIRTRLLQEAADKGAVPISGLDMLVWQGALAFVKWTGRTAPLDIMKKAVVKALATDEK